MGNTSRKTPVKLNKYAAQADKIILTGAITMHFIAGFSGGRKSVLPGIAGYETIQKNHSHSLAKEVGAGYNEKTRLSIIDDNPLSNDMREACLMINPCFLINAIIDSEGNFSDIVAGHWDKAWIAGAQIVSNMQSVKIKGKSDIVIASAGGYPKDINMYQAAKVYDVSELALKPGGIIIALLEGREINEPRDYIEHFHFDDIVEMEKAVRKQYTIPFFAAFRLFSLCKKVKVYIVTKPENFETVRKTGQIPFATIKEAFQSAQTELTKKGIKDWNINILPYAANTIPITI
jgi:nickel-dependent lactate racemase